MRSIPRCSNRVGVHILCLIFARQVNPCIGVRIHRCRGKWLSLCSISCTDDIVKREMPKTRTSSKLHFDDPLKEATLAVLKRVIDPLVDLMFDSGVTVHELSRLAREIAVRTAARRVITETGRTSKSRVAIITGLPRAEVARVLKSGEISSIKRSGQHPARKVLAAWFDNPRFLTPNGDPAILPIFGKRRSFEKLVAMQSRGMPVRAMLDELTQIDAVEILADQRVKAKSRVPILTGLTSSAIDAIGERTRDLLETLTKNLRHTSKPLFEGTAVVDEADLELVSLVRREIAEQGMSLINSANSLLSRSCAKPNQSMAKSPIKCRLGVTVYYFQDDIDSPIKLKSETICRRRKNFQRKRRTSIRKRMTGMKAR